MKRKLILILSVLLFMGAVAVTAYPMIANYINDKHQSAIRIEYVQEVEALGDSEIRDARQAAIAYNESLKPIRYDREAVQAAAESYDDLLNLHGSGLMGYVEIPKIDVNLPIYHGTSEEVLQIGIGHLVGSSLPIGGEGFHSVLTGHSGLAGAKLFSDLDQLAPGDTFFLHILGETLAYEVTEINLVLPHETELLTAVAGEDLCTLVTCTPYGVNTHRLLVRGSRVPFEKTAEEIAKEAPKEPVRSTWKENYLEGLAIGGGSALGAVLLGLGIAWLRRRKHHET
ncbi:MAG: class C sortase [Bacteroidales bacterium]|nr:class C sortase [Bacteroidales bacterium]